jgi:phosphoglycolate phosphatase-like HAD superfamily hydrolase
MMSEAYQPVRDLVRQALLDSAGDWSAAEQLCYRQLAQDPVLREQIAQLCVEWVIRNVITTEGRRQQQQEADRLREAREAAAHDQQIRQALDEVLDDLRSEDGRISGRPLSHKPHRS